jgi:hypothetical protein
VCLLSQLHRKLHNPGWPGHKLKYLLEKIMRAKRARGMAQGVEHLTSKYEVLNSNPSTAKNKSNF